MERIIPPKRRMEQEATLAGSQLVQLVPRKLNKHAKITCSRMEVLPARFIIDVSRLSHCPHVLQAA